MKICVIHGQSHKGSTYEVCHKFLDKIKDKEIVEYFLPRDFGAFCIGCTNCILKGEHLCKDREARDIILNSMLEADLLVFTTPTYVYHATGAMKAFLDHFGYMWMVHRPKKEMFNKQAVVISTAAGAGTKSAIKDIKDSLFFYGIPKIYKLGFSVFAASPEHISAKTWKKIDKKTTKVSSSVIRKDGNVKPGFKTKAFFGIMRLMNKNGWNEIDTAYYQENGWDKKKRPWKK